MIETIVFVVVGLSFGARATGTWKRWLRLRGVPGLPHDAGHWLAASGLQFATALAAAGVAFAPRGGRPVLLAVIVALSAASGLMSLIWRRGSTRPSA